MAPIRSHFILISKTTAFNQIPISFYKSCKTGLTVAIADIEGPVVSGCFSLATEALDDDGLPHTLEHLVFLGSENYPYKGVLDLLANRCLASGTNASTGTDFTCYTMETAGCEGFLSLMPIYLEHILYPTLTNEAFTTEIYHITEEGADAGVVYSERQGRENTGISKVRLESSRALYPIDCGYSKETRGIMKNLRESTNNEKIRKYHNEFYCPENLTIIITGQVKPEEIFEALLKLEHKILSKKSNNKSFKKPWQNPISPLLNSVEKDVLYPSSEEDNGIVNISWRGPSACTEQYLINATAFLLKYLSESSVSPLQQEFVEISDPYASSILSYVDERYESEMIMMFVNVPKDKLKKVKPMLLKFLNDMVLKENIDMDRLHRAIEKYNWECLSTLEIKPHQAMAFMILFSAIYGQNQEDMEERFNPLILMEKLEKEPKSFWIKLLKKYLIDANNVCIIGIPSINEQNRLAEKEAQRIENNKKCLTESGLKKKGKDLQEAVDYNSRPPPQDMLTSIKVPSADSINFYKINRYSSTTKNDKIDLSRSPIFTYFDDVHTNFIYMYMHVDTSEVPDDLKLYMPLLLEAFFESPIKRGNTLVPYEEIVAELESDTIKTEKEIGFGENGRFSNCQTLSLLLLVEESKYKNGLTLFREILYQTEFNAERLQVIATKMINDVAQARCDGDRIALNLLKDLCYSEDSNMYSNNMIRQQKHLSEFVDNLKLHPNVELANIEKLRRILTSPSNLTFYFAANLNHFNKDLAESLSLLLPEKQTSSVKSLNVTPDYKHINFENKIEKGCIIGLGSIESAYLFHVTSSIYKFDDLQVPALRVYLQYLTQLEGPLWKNIRGKGLAYGYAMVLRADEGLLYLSFSRSNNVIAAFKESQEMIMKQITEQCWDEALLESAKSSLIFEIIDEEKTISDFVQTSMLSYFKQVDYSYNRWLISSIGKVTENDLNAIGKKYIAQLFDPKMTKTSVVCNPSKVEEIASEFKNMNYKLNTYATLEERFLNEI